MNVGTWFDHAKQATKTLSDLMYVPPEDATRNNKDESLSSPAADALNDEIKTLVSDEAYNDISEAAEESNAPLDTGDSIVIDMETAREAIESAKKLATSLLSFAKDATVMATSTAEETAKKLQSVVAEKTFIGAFEAERAKFSAEVDARKLPHGSLPWSDLPDQSIAKKHILGLSLDSRNFLRDPPNEINFDLCQMQTIATVLLQEDPNLRKIRYQLVPKKISEEKFWSNYFYRISLIRKSILGENNMVEDNPICSKQIEKEAENDEKEEMVGQAIEVEKIVQHVEIEAKEDENIQKTEEEKKMLKNVRDIVTKEKARQLEEEWENEILNELSDFELVAEQTGKNDEQWEKEIDEILEDS